MKASDSVNSLTELTTHQEQNTCFICLEEDTIGFPLVHSKLLRNCGCRFYVHANCWNVWIQNKTDYDCPICHKESIKINIPPNPVLVFQEQLDVPQQTRRKKIILFVVFMIVIFVSSILIERMIHSG